MKLCKDCGLEKDLNEFDRMGKEKKYICSYCKPCRTIRSNNTRLKRIARYEEIKAEYAATHPTKRCSVAMGCGQELPLKEFYENRGGVGGLSNTCKRCKKGENIIKYGITVAEFENKLAEQNNKCLLCRKDFGATKKEGLPHIDHDHSCCPGRKACGKCVRGILCNRCNTAIGSMNDDYELLQRASTYVQEFRSKL